MLSLTTGESFRSLSIASAVACTAEIFSTTSTVVVTDMFDITVLASVTSPAFTAMSVNSTGA